MLDHWRNPENFGYIIWPLCSSRHEHQFLDGFCFAEFVEFLLCLSVLKRSTNLVRSTVNSLKFLKISYPSLSILYGRLLSHSCLCQCLKWVAKNLLFKFDFPESKNLDALLYVYSFLVPKNCQVKVCCRGIVFLPKLSVIYYYEETILYLTNSVWLRPRFQLSRKAWQAVLFPHGPTEAGLEIFQINKK